MTRSVINRRNLLMGGATIAAGLLGAIRLGHGRDFGGGQGIPWREGLAYPPQGPGEASFFTHEERLMADALTSRIIPTDESGPGAREADVVNFIDRQLAGFYGRAQRWYMNGPFPHDPLDTQGYQLALAPAALWREGLRELEAHTRDSHDGRSFADISEDEQDAVLRGIDQEQIAFETVPAKRFFEFVREMTVEGFFCDPVHGGNRDMVGWHYVGFPGARYDYRDFLDHDGRAIDIPPVSLVGRPGWNRS